MALRDHWVALTVFVYNLAVVLSGYFTAQTIGTSDRVVMILVGSGLALGWTIYFVFVMGPRLERGYDETETEDSGQELP